MLRSFLCNVVPRREEGSKECLDCTISVERQSRQRRFRASMINNYYCSEEAHEEHVDLTGFSFMWSSTVALILRKQKP